MKLKILNRDLDDNEVIWKEVLIIGNPIWYKCLDNMPLPLSINEVKGTINWLTIFAILKWIEENKIGCEVKYVAGKKITIE